MHSPVPPHPRSAAAAAVAVVAFLLVAPPPAAAQAGTEPGVTDLVAAYALAEENDLELQAQRLIHESRQQVIPAARAELLPSLDARLSAGRSRDDLVSPEAPFTVEGSSSFNTWGYVLSLQQTVYDHAKRVGLRTAKAIAAVADTDLERARQDLILRTAAAYLAVLAAQDDLDLEQAEAEAARRRLELTDVRIESGLEVSTARHEATARLRLAEARASQSLDLLTAARERLEELIGRPVGTLARLGGSFLPQEPTPPDVEEWVRAGLESSLALERTQRSAEVARHDADRRRAEAYPRLDLVARHVYLDEEGSIAGPPITWQDTDVFVRLSWDVFRGGKIRAQARAAALERDAAERQLALQQRRTRRDVRTAFAAVGHSVERLRALDDAVDASQSAVDEKEEGAEAGLYTNLDVLDAQRDLFRASRDRSRARHEHMMAVLDLEAAVGDLDRADLERLATWLR